MQPCLDDFRTTFDDYAEMQTYHARQTRESKWARKTVSSLHRATGRKLHERSIHTIGQLANTDPRWLRSWFGKWGDVLYTFADTFI